jgi:Pvc16 N-terminal domain
MSVSMSGRAIGAVTEIIRNNLLNLWQSAILPPPDVTIGRPEVSTTAPPIQSARLNLFLYELKLDPFLRNTPPVTSQPTPLWIDAKYLLTSFDSHGESDSAEALRYLGEGMRILASLNTIPIENGPLPELDENPQSLRLTIEDVGVELLSRIMQGPDQRYRSSAGFEVRPIMIAPSGLPTYSLLVGIDYTKDPAVKIGLQGIKIDVESLPPRPSIIEISPRKFEIDNTIVLYGRNLNVSDLSAFLGSEKLIITSQKNDTLECLASLSHTDENSIMAGNHTLYLVQNLAMRRRRISNVVIGSLIPLVDSATPSSLIKVNDPTTGKELIEGNIDVIGNLLGRNIDDVIVGLYKNGSTTNVLTNFIVNPSPFPSPPQHSVRLKISKENKVEPDSYRLIYTVNGQQAKDSFLVRLNTP